MAVERPRLIEQTRGLDFGAGFYLTTSESQAVRRFSNPDVLWLRFVTENRLKIRNDDSDDIVIGAVANDTVMPALQAFWGGFLTEEAAIITLKASKLVDQFCIKSDKALALLYFQRSYTVDGGIGGE